LHPPLSVFLSESLGSLIALPLPYPCEQARGHLGALRGAKRVVISAPAKDDTPMLVMGVNHTLYNPEVSGM